MRGRMLRAPRPSATAVGTVLALLMLAGAAYAGITVLTASEVITACKTVMGGSLRVVDNASDCRNREEPITWNVEGPQGPPGPPGPPGSGGTGISKLEYVTAGPDTASQQAVEAVCGQNLFVVGGAVRNRPLPGTIRASHPSDGTGSGARGSRGWYGVVAGGSGAFSVYAICAPAGTTEFRSAGGQYGAQYGG